MDDIETDLSLDSIFIEPIRPPTPESTTVAYTRDLSPAHGPTSWKEIKIRLVGSHPLWGHYLWNAARSFATFLDTHPNEYERKCVLELGAGGGLPGIVAAKNGARMVVLTDYPDLDLMKNLEWNVSNNFGRDDDRRERVSVQGYTWGRSVTSLLAVLPETSLPKGFDVIIMSDLIFNHSQHDALLKTCDSCTCDSSKPQILVFYTHHRPHLAHRDMEFFEKASVLGWVAKKIVTEKFPPMFPDDPGEEEVRSTVHGWRLTRQC